MHRGHYKKKKKEETKEKETPSARNTVINTNWYLQKINVLQIVF